MQAGAREWRSTIVIDPLDGEDRLLVEKVSGDEDLEGGLGSLDEDFSGWLGGRAGLGSGNGLEVHFATGFSGTGDPEVLALDGEAFEFGQRLALGGGDGEDDALGPGFLFAGAGEGDAADAGGGLDFEVNFLISLDELDLVGGFGGDDLVGGFGEEDAGGKE